MSRSRRQWAKRGRRTWYWGALTCFQEALEEIEAGCLRRWNELGDERHITGALIDRITDEQFQNKLNERIKEAGGRIELTWKSDRQERSTGADIGAIIDIHLPHLCERKGLLLQAKRFNEAKGVFRSVGKKQADQMTQTTSSSFYIFYHPKGFRVTSASNVLGILATSQDSMDLGLARLEVIPLLRFSDFMVNYFMKTLVGDPRSQIVNGIRDGNLAEFSLEMIARSGESALY